MRKHQPRARPQKRRRGVTSRPSLAVLVDELRCLDDGQQRWWHGGVPGLQPGELLLPAAATNTAAATDKLLRVGYIKYSAAWVYAADKIDLAIIFAGRYRHGAGAVYEIEPLGEIEIDPDGPHDCTSIMCERARIIRRVDVDKRLLHKIKSVQIQTVHHAGRARLA